MTEASRGAVGGQRAGISRVSQEAAEWCVRLQEEPDSEQTRAEFQRWLARGVGHVEELLFAQMIFKELDRLDRSLDPGSFAASDSLVEFPRTHGAPDAVSVEEPLATAAPSIDPGRPKNGRRLAAWAAFAATILIMLGGWWGWRALDGTVYSTRVGSQEIFKLEDGSLIHLNTRTRALVRFSKQRREVRLLQGEALFAVAHDAVRPFIVTTDTAQVRAIGTQFNVYRDGAHDTKVSVLEGVVQVTSLRLPDQPLEPAPANVAGVPGKAVMQPETLRLAAGDEAAVRNTRLLKVSSPDVDRAVAWRTRRLVFPDGNVAQIADEFNRYNVRQIRIEGQRIRERKMTGVFDADDPKPMIRFLARDPGIEIVSGEQEVLIREKR